VTVGISKDLQMRKSLVREAAAAFNKGHYAEAKNIYHQLAEELGEYNFRANLILCQQQIQKQLPRQLTDLSLRNLRVAAVMDEFSYHSFAPECKLLNLHAHRWREEIEAFQPEFIFIESTWSGVEDSWHRKVSDPSEELSGLLDWARKRGINTAFWCKEDPIHFTRFFPVARLVDHIFTTDIDCIIRYKVALKHDRVYLLPFAAQPTLHNPIETVTRKDIFSFAGSWYPKYPDRQTDFRTLVGVGRKLKSVDIYDRNANRPKPHVFEFPEEFYDEIRGSLPYTEIDLAYKGYRYGITVNTIKQSQTMFARRALELMASNTVVISNFSKGLRLTFGDNVISSDSNVELENKLTPLCADESLYRRHRLRALRKVLAEHTYEHRLAYAASKVLNRPYRTSSPRIAMIGEPANDVEAARLVATLDRQNCPNVTLFLISYPDIFDHPRVEVIPNREGALTRLADFHYIAPLTADDYYGQNYINDLAQATSFKQGDGFTKSAFYLLNSAGVIGLKGDGNQYRPTSVACLRRSMLRPMLLTRWAKDAAITITTGTIESSTLFSIDEFSYCAEANGTPISEVDVGPHLRPGLSLFTQILPMAETIQSSEQPNNASPSILLHPKEWQRMLPIGIDSRLTVRVTHGESVEIESTLPTNENQYLYFDRRFTPDELNIGDDTIFKLDGDTNLDVRTVFVFYDANNTKIAHAMQKVGASHALKVPPASKSLRLGLRIQGSGSATLGKLSFVEGEICNLPTDILSSAQNLVVTQQYPSYSDLYRYGFVHMRVQAYAKAGVTAEILRISNDPRVVYREFEGVDVTEGDALHLEQRLASGRYKRVLVHIIDQRIWSVLSKYIDSVHVVIWAHGSEIQPWWRRSMNLTTDVLRDQARKASDARMRMWKEIFNLHHPNLRVVFISHKQAGEALSDLQLPAAKVVGIEVIPNFINGDLFSYKQKDPALRHRLLSIRPYSSPVYANDLTVAAILRLAQEPFFDQLHVRIIGDGVLFDDTVAPLRDFPNVQIERKFLTQREIAALHSDYGVFMVPSRMDSQGVSRDEAMASGLVPITNRVAAIPEFVDNTCAFLVEPEGITGIANAVCRLHADPLLFCQMSQSAARRVRSQSSHAQTISRELTLFVSNPEAIPRPDRLESLVAEEARAIRFALYGDINLNIMDGSAIWASSLAEVLAGIPDVRVALLLKARIHRTQVIVRLLDMAPQVQLIEPDVPKGTGLTPAESVALLVSLDAKQPYHEIILRGLEVCHAAAQESALYGRFWAYLTDVPQKAELMDYSTRKRIEAIISASRFLLCQTPQMLDYFVSMFPQVGAKAKLLPPMVPPCPASGGGTATIVPFRLCYAGKFAPRWGIRELFAAQKKLYLLMPEAELHVFGDKIHNPKDDPRFNATVMKRLEAGKGLHWHGAVDRDELLRKLGNMHVCWAYRDPIFERETLELSTKVLEYASLGLPMILARSQVFEALLGPDYPLFAATAEEASDLLLQLACEPGFRKAAGTRLQQAAKGYTFSAVRKFLLDEGLITYKVIDSNPNITKRTP
jgi:glycosyltransferase involved in cell wall biosynthesis/spore maturation protein CgeB